MIWHCLHLDLPACRAPTPSCHVLAVDSPTATESATCSASPTRACQWTTRQASCYCSHIFWPWERYMVSKVCKKQSMIQNSRESKKDVIAQNRFKFTTRPAAAVRTTITRCLTVGTPHPPSLPTHRGLSLNPFQLTCLSLLPSSSVGHLVTAFSLTLRRTAPYKLSVG